MASIDRASKAGMERNGSRQPDRRWNSIFCDAAEFDGVIIETEEKLKKVNDQAMLPWTVSVVPFRCLDGVPLTATGG